MHRSRRALLLLSVTCPLSTVSCSSDLPPGTTSFTVGRTVVRTDAALDAVGVVLRMADTATVPPRGPVRHWLQALTPVLQAPPFVAARAPGPLPISLVLETYAVPGLPDSACGMVAPGDRRCFTGNQAVRAQVRGFLDSALAWRPALDSFHLEGLDDDSRRRDLGDVYAALTRGRALDSALAAYSGYGDLSYDVVLARTFTTGNTTPGMDPARPVGPRGTIFITPDLVFPTRSYRSPNYVWFALGYQMARASVRRLFAERPDLLGHGWRLRHALEPEMSKVGYEAALWDEILGAQLARAITIRVLRSANPTITWAARAEGLGAGMSLVPWFEDALMVYENDRARYPTLSAFADSLGAALDRTPLDSCRAAGSPGAVLVGVARHRAVVGWLAPDSPLRMRNLVVGDTVTRIDGDSVSAGGLLTPTRQVNLAWAQHLPYELASVDIRRRGRDYAVSVPIRWEPRLQVRIASQARAAVASDTLPICRWNTRARRR